MLELHAYAELILIYGNIIYTHMEQLQMNYVVSVILPSCRPGACCAFKYVMGVDFSTLKTEASQNL